ncbi:NAD-dependent deacetylase [Nakamurella sp. YIM 132084]|uniref:protein acetyllysine N-acetyltransferase n=2 Tax=Nakamurella leprariae TaxID=2803911 RepID=A0A938YK38_9ACTN|nr:NAD-dependent deacetylase [Nakamurella leprariae]
MSTDSGIPDYRGPDAPPRTPMTFQQFVSGPVAQQRYWARSHLGFSTIGRAMPNPGHLSMARLETAGPLGFLITQNVDGLHEAAGSRSMVALHGRIAGVICLDCRRVSSRERLHRRLDELNPDFVQQLPEQLRVNPDGDVELENTAGFRVARCEVCGGVLKPDVVFFGETVPPDRVARSYAAIESAGALLVAGSSLTVMSGYRFVRRAAKLGLPVVIVNRGITRGDGEATVKLDAACAPVLGALADALA